MQRIFLLFSMLFLPLVTWSQVAGDFRSIATGNWATLATWETYNGSAWVAATAAPVTASNVITIRSPHVVTIAAVVAGGIDQVIIDPGATLNTSGAIAQSFANGTGVDLLINGTFGDLSTGSVSFAVGATWQMGANGTLLKTTGSSSNNWQNNYQGGISTIPATSNWILRKIGTQQPAISTTAPATGSFYPNLTIENTTATAWTAPLGSSFQGSTTTATIKGNLDIGGAGTNTVDFQSVNTFTSCVLVQGNVIIRAGSNFRNYGTGLEVQGNFTALGSVTYDANDGRQLIFSGGNAQTISGAGAMAIYTLVFNKSANGVTLSRNMTVDNLATFTNGIVTVSSGNLLTIASTATVGGASNASFVSGPVRYLGNNAFTYPVGKNTNYRPIATSAYASSSSVWFENFNNACTQGCLANSFVGANGAWTVASTGTNDPDANTFFISCAENGNAVGACGTGCGGDATLHVANVSTSPAAFFFCPTGDCGAAYDAGLAANQVRASWRAESPTINLSAYSNLVLSFKYMEGGATTLDNATVWYYDGATWSLLADLAKTATTCAGGQGLWTAYSIALPSSANANANVKIGFQWVNNDDGAGTDPSFAVDNVSIGPTDYFTAEYFYSNPQVVYNNVLAPTLTSISNCEYWVLDRAAGSVAAPTVTLSWDGTSCNVTNLTDLRVARFDLSMWQDHGNGGTTGTVAAGTIVTAAPVTSFSPFTLANYVLPLPIELISFSAACEQDQIVLRWRTASEKNNHFFSIERSVDGQTFAEIARVNGAGNSSTAISYSTIDPHPAQGPTYYRLRQVDFNGEESTSAPVLLDANACGDNTFTLTQTSFDATMLSLNMEHAAGNVHLQIFDVTGRCVADKQVAREQTHVAFETNDWPSGVYLIRLDDGFTTIVRRVVR